MGLAPPPFSLWMGGWVLRDLRLGQRLPQRERGGQGAEWGQEWGLGGVEGRGSGNTGSRVGQPVICKDGACIPGAHLGCKSTFPGTRLLLGAAPCGPLWGRECRRGRGSWMSPWACWLSPLQKRRCMMVLADSSIGPAGAYCALGTVQSNFHPCYCVQSP